MSKLLATLLLTSAALAQADINEVYLYPDFIHDPDSRIVVQNGILTVEPFVFHKNQMFIRHMGETAVDNDVTWDASVYTGFKPVGSLSKYQRGEYDQGPPSGTNAYQLQGYSAGCMLNTWSFNWIPVAGGGPQCAVQHYWDTSLETVPKPWTVDDASLTVQFNHKIPWYAKFGTSQNLAVAQVNMIIYLRDGNEKDIAIVIGIFDPRGAYQEYVSDDGYSAYVSSPLLDGGRYITKSPYSHSHMSTTFSDSKFARVHITGENLDNIIQDVNAKYGGQFLSLDKSEYKLRHVLWNLEIGGYSDTENVSIGASMTNLIALSCTGVQC